MFLPVLNYNWPKWMTKEAFIVLAEELAVELASDIKPCFCKKK